MRVVARRDIDKGRGRRDHPSGQRHPRYRHAENRLVFAAKPEPLVAIRALAGLEPTYEIDPRFVSDGSRAKQLGDVEDAQAADCDMVADEFGRVTDDVITFATDTHEIVCDETLPPRHEFERRFALAGPTRAEDEDAHAVNLDEITVNLFVVGSFAHRVSLLKLGVLFLDGPEDVVEAPRLEKRLSERGIAEEARDASQRFQVLTTGMLWDH